MNLVSETDPILRSNVLGKQIDWRFLHQNQEKMYNIMTSNGGMGLAANQLGIEQPFFITNGELMPSVICYPKITAQSEISRKDKEGCLSFPGLILTIPRSVEIEVTFFDVHEKYQSLILRGLAARLFLHEYDHLNGICFVDRAAKLSLKMALEKRKKQ